MTSPAFTAPLFALGWLGVLSSLVNVLPACGPSGSGHTALAAPASGTRTDVLAHPPRLVRLGGGQEALYDASCTRDDECAVAWIPLDCCGSHAALGVRRSGRADLERAGKQAEPSAGSCECLAAPTRLDSGETATNAAAVGVMCRENGCATSLRVVSVSK